MPSFAGHREGKVLLRVPALGYTRASDSGSELDVLLSSLSQIEV